MAINLKKELEEHGFDRHPDDFRVIVLEVFNGVVLSRHPEWTDEELLMHPAEAIRYCGAVNQEAGTEIPDYVTLRTLTNCRKAKFGIDPTT